MTEIDVTFTDVSVPWRDRPLETKQATLSNGVTITRLGPWGPQLNHWYGYRDDELEFEFLATRWSEDHHPSDTFHVSLGLGLHRLPADQKAKIGDAVIERLKSNIGVAMLKWPPLHSGEAKVGLKFVTFSLVGWGEAWAIQR